MSPADWSCGEYALFTAASTIVISAGAVGTVAHWVETDTMDRPVLYSILLYGPLLPATVVFLIRIGLIPTGTNGPERYR